MVESILNLSEEFLSEKLPSGLDIVQDLSSKTFMLDLLPSDEIPEFGDLCQQLYDRFLELKDQLHNPNLAANQDSVITTAKEAEHIFFQALLSPLEIPEREINAWIAKTMSRRHMQTLELLEIAFNYYISKENDELTFTNVAEKLLQILEKFGFKKTLYLELSVYRALETQFSPGLLQEKLSGSELISFFKSGDENYNEADFFQEETVSTDFVIQRVCDFISRNKEETPPFLIIKEIFQELQIPIEKPKSACNQIVYSYFLTIEEFFNQHRLNACIYKFELSDDQKPELASRALFQADLNFQILRPTRMTPKPHYEKGFVYKISPLGFRDSSRFCYDRMVLIGKFTEDCLENDIFLDESFLSQHLMIASDNDGYYICDYSVMGLTGRKMGETEEVELKTNSIFQLGPLLYMAVVSIYSFEGCLVVKMKVLKGCGLNESYFFGVFKPGQERELLMGRAQNAKVFVNETTVSRDHCKLVLRDEKVFLRALNNTSGTYVNLKNLEELRHKSPSAFYHIEKQADFMINEMIFRFTPSQV